MQTRGSNLDCAELQLALPKIVIRNCHEVDELSFFRQLFGSRWRSQWLLFLFVRPSTFC
jgi:hypothetical protein